MNAEPHRCPWCLNNPLMKEYHDREWGVPVYDDKVLFEFLILEGAQAGLSWQTVLNKRAAYYEAFDGFDAQKISCYQEEKVSLLLGNAGIIRNRLKVASAIQNARAFLKVQQEYGSFHTYLWKFVDGQPKDHKIKEGESIPCSTKESDAMSKDLLKRGFKFVGTKICYSLMQAVGMVNDHETTCFRYQEVKQKQL